MMIKGRSIATAIVLAALLAAFAAPTVGADEGKSISILIHPCSFVVQPQTGFWETTGAITDHGTYVHGSTQAFPPGLPPFTPGVLVVEKFLLSNASGTLGVTTATTLSQTFVLSGRWWTTEGTGAYEDAEWHGRSVTIDFSAPQNSCPPPQNHVTFALTGVTDD
jgi:hypothetical protein